MLINIAAGVNLCISDDNWVACTSIGRAYVGLRMRQCTGAQAHRRTERHNQTHSHKQRWRRQSHTHMRTHAHTKHTQHTHTHTWSNLLVKHANSTTLRREWSIRRATTIGMLIIRNFFAAYRTRPLKTCTRICLRSEAVSWFPIFQC